MARSYGREPYALLTFGGSLPLVDFVDAPDATVITVPMVNAVNSQPAPNENVRAQNLWDGIVRIADIMIGLGREWPSAPKSLLLQVVALHPDVGDQRDGTPVLAGNRRCVTLPPSRFRREESAGSSARERPRAPPTPRRRSA